MRTAALFLVAALLELGGGYLVWMWLRRGASPLVGLAGLLALALYGVVPTLQARALGGFGRIYAAYGAVFIVGAMAWAWRLDGEVPDFRDGLGAVLCLVGAAVMMWPRAGLP